MDGSSRAQLLRAALLACHRALVVKLHALVDLVDNAHHVALRATHLLLMMMLLV